MPMGISSLWVPSLRYWSMRSQAPSNHTFRVIHIQPGDEWFARIHTKLVESETVWVLATAGSIARPWVYWEAGLGRAVCPGGIVVLRIGLRPDEIPSPLNAYQSYDGLSVADGGVLELVAKVGDQIGMNVQPDWLTKCASAFVEAAKKHEPAEEEEGDVPRLTPEDVSRVDGLIGRLELVARRIETASEDAAPESVAADEVERARKLEERRDRLAQVVGQRHSLFDTPEALLARAEADPELELTVRGSLDFAGDIIFDAKKGGESVQVYLRTTMEALDQVEAPANSVLEGILQGAKEVLKASASPPPSAAEPEPPS